MGRRRRRRWQDDHGLRRFCSGRFGSGRCRRCGGLGDRLWSGGSCCRLWGRGRRFGARDGGRLCRGRRRGSRRLRQGYGMERRGRQRGQHSDVGGHRDGCRDGHRDRGEGANRMRWSLRFVELPEPRQRSRRKPVHGRDFRLDRRFGDHVRQASCRGSIRRRRSGRRRFGNRRGSGLGDTGKAGKPQSRGHEGDYGEAVQAFNQQRRKWLQALPSCDGSARRCRPRPGPG